MITNILFLYRNDGVVIGRRRLPETRQEKNVRGRNGRGKRQTETGAERLRSDRPRHRVHVRHRRLRFGRDGGQVCRRSRGRTVFYPGRGRLFVFRLVYVPEIIGIIIL